MPSADRSGWSLIEPILDQVLDLPTTDRAAYLARACAGDQVLRDRIEQMLAAGEDPDSPLERSVAELAGPLLAEFNEFAPPPIPLGELIGPWKVTAELGQGGMGAVYKAERADGQFAQTAALKVVRRGGEHDPLLIRRFLEERRILATLTHPHIARLLDGGVTPHGLPYFAMEFVAGRPLDQYCTDLALDIPARLALMEQVLGAVAYAHRNLLVHRDLKPSNIFVTDEGEVKLLDFGIAKLLGDDHPADPALTLASGRVMTPEYAAPEQVRGDPITTATDIYALGAVLYQLLTGRRAHRFDKRTAAEIEKVVCEADPVAPSAAVRGPREGMAGAADPLPRSLSGDLDTLVLTALQKDPARRYASAEAMLDDLRRWRTGRPLLARPDSAGYRARKFVGRHRVGVSAAALVILALAGGIVATAWQARAARLEARRADRVKEFLADLLHQADPDVTGGQEFSVRQLLDRGTRRIDSMLGSEPAVQAELYEVLGNTYAHLGLLEQADTLHRKGLAVVRRLYGPGSPELLDHEMAVGWGLNDRGRYRDADTLLTRAIGAYEGASGPESQALSDAIDILATARKRLDHPEQAESLYRQSLALQIRLSGPNDTITASRLSDLGSLLAAQNRLAPAESAMVAAQAHRKGVLSPLDVRYLAGESSVATILMKRGDLAGAEPHLRTAVAGLEQIEAPRGLNLARVLDRLALLESLEGQDSAALATSRRAVAMFHDVMGPDHPERFNSLSLRSFYEARTGELATALIDARSAQDGLQKKLGADHEWTLLAGQRLAEMELAAGRPADAARTDSMVLAKVRAKYGKVTPAFAGTLAVEAALLARQHDSLGAQAGVQAAHAALAGGTRVDSAAFSIVPAILHLSGVEPKH